MVLGKTSKVKNGIMALSFGLGFGTKIWAQTMAQKLPWAKDVASGKFLG